MRNATVRSATMQKSEKSAISTAITPNPPIKRVSFMPTVMEKSATPSNDGTSASASKSLSSRNYTTILHEKTRTVFEYADETPLSRASRHKPFIRDREESSRQSPLPNEFFESTNQLFDDLRNANFGHESESNNANASENSRWSDMYFEDQLTNIKAAAEESRDNNDSFQMALDADSELVKSPAAIFPIVAAAAEEQPEPYQNLTQIRSAPTFNFTIYKNQIDENPSEHEGSSNQNLLDNLKSPSNIFDVTGSDSMAREALNPNHVKPTHDTLILYSAQRQNGRFFGGNDQLVEDISSSHSDVHENQTLVLPGDGIDFEAEKVRLRSKIERIQKCREEVAKMTRSMEALRTIQSRSRAMSECCKAVQSEQYEKLNVLIQSHKEKLQKLF